jgi:hydrogenase maturation protease
MTAPTRSWAPVAVVALGDPNHRDEGLPIRMLGRVRTLIGEIGCSRSLATRPASSTAGATSDARRSRDRVQEASGVLEASGAQPSLPLPESSPLGPVVEWIEGGTESQRLEPLLDDRRRVVLIDTVRFGGPPGNVYHWHLEKSPFADLTLLRHFGKTSEMRLDHLAFWLEDDLPVSGIDLIAIEPSDVSEGAGFSRVIRRRFPTICSRVTALLFRVLVEEGW